MAIFEKAPLLWNNERLAEYCKTGEKHLMSKGGTDVWVPARPKGLYSLSNRLSLAWMVFTGKADAVFWTGDQ